MLIKKIGVLSVVSSFLIVGVVHSNDDVAEEGYKAHRELKREQKQERREMRRAHRAESMLLRVDTNKDGQVDLNEYLAHAQERFNKLDTDANGFVTKEEAKESMQKMREEHKERRKKMREQRKAEYR